MPTIHGKPAGAPAPGKKSILSKLVGAFKHRKTTKPVNTKKHITPSSPSDNTPQGKSILARAATTKPVNKTLHSPQSTEGNNAALEAAIVENTIPPPSYDKLYGEIGSLSLPPVAMPDITETTPSATLETFYNNTPSAPESAPDVARPVPLPETRHQRLEKGLAVGAVTAAVTSGAAVAAASALKPDTPDSAFDHILQKDTPIDQMTIFAQHNTLSTPGKGTLPIVTNQTLSIEDTLEETPVRAFDIDLHEHNGEVVINHGGYFDPAVKDEDIPRVDDALNPINSWLEDPDNKDEVVFLNFENKHHLEDGTLENTFGDKLLTSEELATMYKELGRMPTVNELTADGPKVIVIDNSRYHSAGNGEVQIISGDTSAEWSSVWEDRTVIGAAGPETHDAIAGYLTTDDTDRMLSSNQGHYVSLDQISPNDPRFYTPEDRADLALNPDNSMMGMAYYSDDAFQTALLGFSTAASAATGGLALASGIYQATRNEKQIRQQKSHAQSYLKNVATVTILAKRKQQKKPLDVPITAEEIKQLYRDEQLSEITKNTLMPGASGTLAVSGSLLTLGMVFPPLFPAFAAASAGAGGAGLLSTAAATIGNRARLKKAVDKTFCDEKMQLQFNDIAQQLESERQVLAKPDDGSIDPNAVEQQLLKAVDKKFEVDRLNKASQIMLGGSLVARVSGMSKYGIPALGAAAMGVGAALTGVMVGLSAATNFKERRRKLDNIPQTMAEVIRPNLEEKRFGLFGATKFERYVEKHWSDLQKKYKDLPGKNHKDMQKMLDSGNVSPEGAQAFQYCRRDCAQSLWEEQLTTFAKKQKPPVVFQDVKSDPKKLRDLLKSYAVKSIGDFAHNDTFSSGRNNTLRLSVIGAFAGVFFLPMLGVAAGALATGLGVSKGVAVHERKVFEKALSKAMNEPGDDLEAKMAHRKVNGLIDAWSRMIAGA